MAGRSRRLMNDGWSLLKGFLIGSLIVGVYLLFTNDAGEPVTETTTSVVDHTQAVTTTTTEPPTTTLAEDLPLVVEDNPTIIQDLDVVLVDQACEWVREQPGDKFLDRIVHLCIPVALARLDIEDIVNPDHLNVPPYDEEQFRKDVVHMLYVVSFESAGDPIANSVNWGCPRDERLRPEDESVCRYFGGRVPLGYVSHMSHLVEDRSLRILEYLIDAYDIYESTLLGFGLVYEVGGNGWYHWWHIHWGLNSFLKKHDIRQVWYCPPNAYWQNVRGGKQECP